MTTDSLKASTLGCSFCCARRRDSPEGSRDPRRDRPRGAAVFADVVDAVRSVAVSVVSTEEKEGATDS